MDWKFILYAVDHLSATYMSVFSFSWLAVNMLRELSKIYPKLEEKYWKSVSIYRFFYPVRKFMWVFYAVTQIINSVDSSLLDKIFMYSSLLCAFFFCFVYKDDHGDDPRDKKPSKVKAFVKSMGHRLIVVPSHA